MRVIKFHNFLNSSFVERKNYFPLFMEGLEKNFEIALTFIKDIRKIKFLKT